MNYVLNLKYAFENFVVDDGNELAYLAALRIAEDTARYNPFFLYGKWKAGKTHLLRAIENTIKKRHESRKILYAPGEEFFLDILINSDTQSCWASLEKWYQNYDVLIVDGVDVFLNKERTQGVAMELFDTLYANNKQIIVTSELPPRRLPVIEGHFRSFYDGAMMVEIRALDRNKGSQKET